MLIKDKKSGSGFIERFSGRVTKVTGSSAAFIVALLLLVCWAITGPTFHYSENWQLVINTGTNIITFLMVLLIQKAENKDSLAIQLKLNELITAHQFASNRLVNAENMTDEEMKSGCFPLLYSLSGYLGLDSLGLAQIFKPFFINYIL